MTCPYRLGDCTPVDPDTDLWTGTLPKRSPNRYGFVHRHNHLLCVTDGPDSEVGWHPADDEAHPEPWPWRRARHPIQLAHPHDGRILAWRVVASTIVATRAKHAPALAALDTIYQVVLSPVMFSHLAFDDVLAPLGRVHHRERALRNLGNRWTGWDLGTAPHPSDWTPPPEWVRAVWGCGPGTADAYRILALGEDVPTTNPVLAIHVALRRAGRLPATTLAP